MSAAILELSPSGIAASSAGKALWKNVFKNPILARLSSELKGISSMNEDDQADIMEGAIGYIYAYAKDVRINLDMKKCPYDQAQLDAMSYVAFSQAKKGA